VSDSSDSVRSRHRILSLDFRLAVEALGIRHRYIKPRRPQQNGKAERSSHRIDQLSRHRFTSFDDAADALRRWEHAYNVEGSSLALHGYTPAEIMAQCPSPLLAAPPSNPERASTARSRRLRGSVLTEQNTSVALL